MKCKVRSSICFRSFQSDISPTRNEQNSLWNKANRPNNTNKLKVKIMAEGEKSTLAESNKPAESIDPVNLAYGNWKTGRFSHS